MVLLRALRGRRAFGLLRRSAGRRKATMNDLMRESMFGTPAAELAPGPQRRRSLPRASSPANASRSSPTRRAAKWRPASPRRSTTVGAPLARRAHRAGRDAAADRRAAEVLDALERADAGILCVQPQQGELGARMAIVAASSSAARSATRTWSASRRRSCGRACAPTTGWSTRSARACASGCRTRRACASRRRAAPRSPRPSIRRFTWVKTQGSSTGATGRTCRPAKCSRRRRSVDGVFVCDGTAGDYFGPKYGDLRATPLTLEIAGRPAAVGALRAQGSRARVLGLLPHRRAQRPRRRAGVRHQPRPRAR